MFSINWDDVWGMVESILPQLIVVGVVLLLAVVVSMSR